MGQNKYLSLLNKIKCSRLKAVIVFCLCFMSVADSFAATKMEPDKFRDIKLSGRGINTRLEHNSFQSKGLNTLIKVDGQLYMVSLNSSEQIVIDLINDAVIEEIFNTGIVTSNYSAHRGVGTVCTDGIEHLYITYFNDDGTVITAKVSLKTESIIWASSYRLKDVNYLPLDSVYHNGNVYLLVCEDKTDYHLVKIDAASGASGRIAMLEGSKYYLNAIAADGNNICVYGAYHYGFALIEIMYMYVNKFDLNGNSVYSKTYSKEEWIGSITRAAVYDGTEYVTYKQKQSSNAKKNKIIRLTDTFWHKNIQLDVNAIYADATGEYAGYVSGKTAGVQIYNASGAIQKDNFIIMDSNVGQINSVYADAAKTDDAKVVMLSSLSNNDAVLSFIPLKYKAYIYTNDKEEEYKNSVVYPRVTLNERDYFTYKIRYVNYENKPPTAGFPKLHIYKNGIPVVGGPFIMTAEDASDANYTDGKIYKYGIELAFDENTSYSYKIESVYSGELFESEIYNYPVYGNAPKILYFEANTHIFPNTRKYDTTRLQAKAKFLEPNGYVIADGYPVINVYAQDGAPQVLNRSMLPLESEANTGGVFDFACDIGFFPGGKYSYTIEAKNEYGTESEPAGGEFEVVDSFKAGVKADKVFNVPNPFSPHKGPTKIIFGSDKNETVKIRIFSLQGDLVYEDSFEAVTGTNEYEYRGRDNSGKILYNGGYICRLEKTDGKKLKCKILIIK